MLKLRKMKPDLSVKRTMLQGPMLTSSLALVRIHSSKSLLWNMALLNLKKTVRLRVPFLTAYKLEPGFSSLIRAAFYSAESLNSEWSFSRGRVQISVSIDW